jgi:hypothetical protein
MFNEFTCNFEFNVFHQPPKVADIIDEALGPSKAAIVTQNSTIVTQNGTPGTWNSTLVT